MYERGIGGIVPEGPCGNVSVLEGHQGNTKTHIYHEKVPWGKLYRTIVPNLRESIVPVSIVNI